MFSFVELPTGTTDLDIFRIPELRRWFKNGGIKADLMRF